MVTVWMTWQVWHDGDTERGATEPARNPMQTELVPMLHTSPSAVVDDEHKDGASSPPQPQRVQLQV